MESAGGKIKLYYFDTFGRAEPIRILLHHAKVDFDDVRCGLDGFGDLKEKEGHKFEFGQVPVLEMPDGETYAQSISIYRLLGKWYGYYPEDPVAAWQVDSIMEANGEIEEKYWEMWKVKTQNPGVDVTEKVDEIKKEFIEKHMPEYLHAFQKRLIKNGSPDFMVGHSVTLAEFDNTSVAFSYFLNEANEHYKEMVGVL